MADAGDLKSPGLWLCGFESHLRHHIWLTKANRLFQSIFFVFFGIIAEVDELPIVVLRRRVR